MSATVPATDLMMAVTQGLESSISRLEGLQGVVAELVRRADALGDDHVVETVQSLDHLLQGLERLARATEDMHAVAEANAAAMPAFPASAMARLDLFAPQESSGDCDLF